MAVDGINYSNGKITFSDGTTKVKGSELLAEIQGDASLNIASGAIDSTKEYTAEEAQKIIEMCTILDNNTKETGYSIATAFMNFVKTGEGTFDFAKGVTTDEEYVDRLKVVADAIVNLYGDLDGNINKDEFKTAFLNAVGMSDGNIDGIFNNFDITGEEGVLDSEDIQSLLLAWDAKNFENQELYEDDVDGKIDIKHVDDYFVDAYGFNRANGTVVAGDTALVADDDTVVAGDDTVVAGDTALVADDDTVVAGDATVVAGDDTVVAGDATVVAGDDTVVAGNATTTMVGTKTDADVTAKIATLRAQYAIDSLPAYNGDVNSLSNPQLQKFSEVHTQMVADLAAEGYTDRQIYDITLGVFDHMGLGYDNAGKAKVPYGHNSAGDAKAVYDSFLAELRSVPSGSSAAAEEIKLKINQATTELNKNVANMQIIKKEINRLKGEIDDLVADVKREAADIEDEYIRQAQATVASEIDDYRNSDGKMSYSQFEAHLTSELNKIDPSGRLSACAAKLTQAENKYTQIRNFTASFNQMKITNDTLLGQIAQYKDDLAAELAKPAEAPLVDNVQRTDPIGFKLADNVRIDFFFDRDENGELTDETEFLGAQNGWAEMIALDTSGDGTVDFDELQASGLKMVYTKVDANGDVIKNADGTRQQQYYNIADFFQAGDSIDLNSYTNNGKMFENGNILQGNFDVNLNDGTKLEGYQTLDTQEWLDNQYNFTNKINGVGRDVDVEINQDALDEVTATDFNSLLTEVEATLTDGWAAFGIERDTIKDKIQQANDASAKAIAQEIAKAFGTDVKDIKMASPEPEDTPPVSGAGEPTVEDVDYTEYYDKNSAFFTSFFNRIAERHTEVSRNDFVWPNETESPSDYQKNGLVEIKKHAPGVHATPAEKKAYAQAVAEFLKDLRVAYQASTDDQYTKTHKSGYEFTPGYPVEMTLAGKGAAMRNFDSRIASEIDNDPVFKEYSADIKGYLEDSDYNFQTAVVADDDTVVTGADTLIADDNAVVAGDDTVVTGADTLVADDNAVVAGDDTVVTGADTLVADDNAVVADDDTVVTGADTLVADDDAVVAGDDTVVTGADTLVADDNAVVADDDAPVTDGDEVAAFTADETTDDNSTHTTDEDELLDELLDDTGN